MSQENFKTSAGRFLERDFKLDEGLLYKFMPYLAYLAVLGVIYIANRNQTERTAKEMNTLRREVEEMRIEYITTKADYMKQWRQSDIMQKVMPLGLKQSTEPPIKIQPEEE
ncbi:MAG: hypothetical protein EAZ57_00610 [Cytophagales bacterium]|nr:MAG: hypothetical protein EAZ67_00520 [Cytophagales bacterium]TAF62290.1 MAG: hypothetical protein EAZ57_00610 [Cytophagales bacterium]